MKRSPSDDAKAADAGSEHSERARALMRPRRNNLLPFACLVVALVAGGCATSLGEGVGVQVVARGNTLQLSWDERHGWQNQLSSRGAEVVAEYEVEGRGFVRESVAQGRREGDRTMGFTLPTSLRNVPAKEVCLYIQLPGNRLLPVRQAAGGRDTARFRYAAWEGMVTANVEQRALNEDVQVLSRHLAQLTEQQQRRSSALQQRGWTDPNACGSQQVTRTDAERQPIGVMPAEQREPAARKVCVHRIHMTRRGLEQRIAATPPAKRLGVLSAYAGSAAHASEVATEMLRLAPSNVVDTKTLRDRQTQARSLNEDLRRWGPTVGPQFAPPLGKYDDVLMVATESRDANVWFLLQIYGKKEGLSSEAAPAPSVRDLLGAMGAVLDAYEGCVQDGKRQLDTISAAWADLQARAPQREQRLNEYFAQQCRLEHRQLQELASQEANARAELARSQERLAGRTAPTGPSVLPSAPTPLNAVSCGA